MNYLIGDIGNTNIKICKLNKKFKITKSFLFDTKDKNLLFKFKKKINKMLQDNTSKIVLFSSTLTLSSAHKFSFENCISFSWSLAIFMGSGLTFVG